MKKWFLAEQVLVDTAAEIVAVKSVAMEVSLPVESHEAAVVVAVESQSAMVVVAEESSLVKGIQVHVVRLKMILLLKRAQLDPHPH
jgi:hypothetical protein